MEGLFLLVGGIVLGIPVIAIVALIRTGSLGRLLDQRFYEQQNTISDLRGRLANLQAEVAQLAARLNQATVASPGSEVAAAPPQPQAQPVPEPQAAGFQNAEASQRAEAPWLEQASAAPEIPQPVVKEPQLEAVAPPLETGFASEAAGAKQTEAAEIPEPLIPAAAAYQAEAPAPEEIPVAATPQREEPPTPQPPRAEIPRYVPAPRYQREPRPGWAARLRATLPLEDVLGMNLFAKIGMILLVFGFALLGRVALVTMGPGGKVALLYAAASLLLGGGIWLERKERYRLIGRTGIGGGWALLFFTTYAMHHVAAMQVMSSNTLNCILLLVVAIAMVVHTLRYQSQLVTGFAFLLAFSTVALSQDTVYALAAGVILAVGIVVIALRLGWYQLEIFGIIASFANHWYWLYRLYPQGMAGHRFPEFLPSAIILLLYWLTFRISYVVRRIRTPQDERLSTIAALINTSLLLTVMKFQSTHPELAFYALLVLGAAEFFFGQLPVTRRRRPAFILLTVLGTMLMFAAVPFKFSGDNIALLWMIAAEGLLIAGIVQAEVVFRRLGLLAGVLTGMLIAFEARHILELRRTSEMRLTQDGILLLTCSLLFYLNALYIRHRWRSLFQQLDEALAIAQSYIGAVTAFLGVWAILTADWTALGWAVLMLCIIAGTRWLQDRHLVAQAWVLGVVVAFRAALDNCHLSELYPHHVTTRLITLPLLALVFYCAAAIVAKVADGRVHLRSFCLWMGSALLVALAWLETAPNWVALEWLGLAVVMIVAARRVQLPNLCHQEHLLALLITGQLVFVNLDAHASLDRYLPFLGCAAMFYGISRLCTLPDAGYRRVAAWAHTWAATALLATLAWHESPQLWLTAFWVVFALALAIVDRVWDVEELPYQAHVLAALAIARAATLNLYSQEKWHGVDVRLLTVSILVAALYALARWVRIPEALRRRELHHAYSWAGSILAAWMLWSELGAISVAPGLAIFGLLLFEAGTFGKQRQLRLQGYAALTAAFVRIFFVNLTATALPGEVISPRIYTIAPIALIYFFVWWQLQSGEDRAEKERGLASYLLAYFGTGCIVALIYFQVSAEWVVVAWAILALALLAATLLLDREVFLQHAALLLAGIVARGIAHNVFGGSYFVEGAWRGNFSVLSLTAALLLAGLPLAFRLRSRYAVRPPQLRISRYLGLYRPEQMFFFAPVVLVTLMIAVKMNPGMVTLSWGVEGVLVILLGLMAAQRSYRITGLLLLLLCVGKIVFRDAWRLSERDRYITFIVLGTALTLVSMLYNKYRDSARRLL